MNVAVLCGGSSYERAVSLRSGRRVAEALIDHGHTPELVDVDAHTAQRLRDAGPDVVFIALHGVGGEDGSIQELLEALGMPYTGTGPGSAATTSDKATAKRILHAAGIPTPQFRSLSARALHELGGTALTQHLTDELGMPLVVKPAVGGSALGVKFAHEPTDLPKAIMGALSYHDHILIEKVMPGREFSVGIVGTKNQRALPPVEIRPMSTDTYDFDARYTHGATELICPPDDLDDEVRDRITEMSLDAYRALGVRGYGRVDLMLDADGSPQILELDTVPGLTSTSLVPTALTAAGMTLADLVAGLLDDALARG